MPNFINDYIKPSCCVTQKTVVTRAHLLSHLSKAGALNNYEVNIVKQRGVEQIQLLESPHGFRNFFLSRIFSDHKAFQPTNTKRQATATAIKKNIESIKASGLFEARIDSGHFSRAGIQTNLKKLSDRSIAELNKVELTDNETRLLTTAKKFLKEKKEEHSELTARINAYDAETTRLNASKVAGNELRNKNDKYFESDLEKKGDQLFSTAKGYIEKNKRILQGQIILLNNQPDSDEKQRKLGELRGKLERFENMREGNVNLKQVNAQVVDKYKNHLVKSNKNKIAGLNSNQERNKAKYDLDVSLRKELDAIFSKLDKEEKNVLEKLEKGTKLVTKEDLAVISSYPKIKGNLTLNEGQTLGTAAKKLRDNSAIIVKQNILKGIYGLAIDATKKVVRRKKTSKPSLLGRVFRFTVKTGIKAVVIAGATHLANSYYGNYAGAAVFGVATYLFKAKMAALLAGGALYAGVPAVLEPYANIPVAFIGSFFNRA